MPPSASTEPARGASASVAQFPVDDEPEDATTASARLRTVTLNAVREGEVLPDEVVTASIERDDDEEEPAGAASVDLPVPQAIVPPRAAPPVEPARGVHGRGQRYGEAVVRQVLGANFVREEPYEPPTRFS